MAAPLSSMTGFGRSSGVSSGKSWAWELRSVNGRGFDLRLKLPLGLEGHDAALRQMAGAVIKRGTVQANLVVQQDGPASAGIRMDVLERLMAVAIELAARIPGAPAPRAEALLALPGVLRAGETGTELPDWAPIMAGFEEALQALLRSRQDEGARLLAILGQQLNDMAGLALEADRTAAAQPQAQRLRLQEQVQALLGGGSPGITEDRLAQELALLASRADVREELDRLGSHLGQARNLLAEGAQVGRRLDFLVQEFNRETNTLCSKSASVALTGIGLRLKAVIEQFREQVQNIE